VSVSASNKTGMRRDVPKGVVIAVIVVIVLAIGAGVFYVINGGFKTQAAKDYEWVHYGYPMKMARKGDLSALEEENKRRKTTGEPLLVAPPLKVPDYGDNAVQNTADQLRKAMQSKQGGAGAAGSK